MPLIALFIEEKDQWEGFIRRAGAKSFLQGWNWGEFHQNTSHFIQRLGVFEGETCILFGQVFIVKARRGNFVFCPHGPLAFD